jgi:hypothetical protein
MSNFQLGSRHRFSTLERICSKRGAQGRRQAARSDKAPSTNRAASSLERSRGPHFGPGTALATTEIGGTGEAAPAIGASPPGQKSVIFQPLRAGFPPQGSCGRLASKGITHAR